MSWNKFIHNIENTGANNDFIKIDNLKFNDLKFKLDLLLSSNKICFKNTDFNILKYYTKKEILIIDKELIKSEIKNCQYMLILVKVYISEKDIHIITFIIDNNKKKIILFDVQNNKIHFEILQNIIKLLNLNYSSVDQLEGHNHSSLSIPIYKIIKPKNKIYENKLGKCDICTAATLLFIISYIKYNVSVDSFINYFMDKKLEYIHFLSNNFIRYLENIK